MVVVLFAVNGLFAQGIRKEQITAPIKAINSADSKNKNIPTFEVINTSGNGKVLLITKALSAEVELLRKESSDHDLIINENFKILIYSKNKLADPNFNPLN